MPLDVSKPSAAAYSGGDTKLRTLVFICLAIFFLSLAVYFQVVGHQFVAYDDDVYVTENPHVTGGLTVANIIWAFTSAHAANWHPLTWLSLMTDAQLFGTNPGGFHLTNVFLHSIAAVLLFLLLLKLTRGVWQSALVAALFAIHPLHVESVAWVAERKDVLSGLLFFLTLYAYAEYVAKRKKALLQLALFCFILGLMAKPMLVTLPLIMLLLDAWPLGRFGREESVADQEPVNSGLAAQAIPLLKEKLPFFACSILSSLVTVIAQQSGRAIAKVPLGLGIENALVAYAKYLVKTCWPVDLAVFYPFPGSIPLWQPAAAAVALLLVTVAAIKTWRRHPFLAVGWFWFLVTLVPVIGVVPVGGQSMADRYSYLPHVGLFIMVAWGAAAVADKLSIPKGALKVLGGAAVVTLTAVTWHQIGYWRDSEALFSHALQVTSGNYMAHNNLGVVLMKRGNLQEAATEYRQALEIKPDYLDAHFNLGIVLADTEHPDAAIKEFETVLRLDPNYEAARKDLALVYDNKGNADANKGDFDSAIKEYDEALSMDPDDLEAIDDLGVALAKKGDLDGAIQQFNKAIALDHNFAQAQSNLQLALAKRSSAAKH